MGAPSGPFHERVSVRRPSSLGPFAGADDGAVVGPPDVFARCPRVRAAAPKVDAIHILQGHSRTQMPDVIQGLVVRDDRPRERPDRVEVGAW